MPLVVWVAEQAEHLEVQHLPILELVVAVQSVLQTVGTVALELL
jgi:hypothetical protein